MAKPFYCPECYWTQKHEHAAEDFSLVGEYRQCEHGYHHPPWPHSCDGCYCDDERDRKNARTPE